MWKRPAPIVALNTPPRSVSYLRDLILLILNRLITHLTMSVSCFVPHIGTTICPPLYAAPLAVQPNHQCHRTTKFFTQSDDVAASRCNSWHLREHVPGHVNLYNALPSVYGYRRFYALLEKYTEGALAPTTTPIQQLGFRSTFLHLYISTYTHHCAFPYIHIHVIPPRIHAEAASN